MLSFGKHGGDFVGWTLTCLLLAVSLALDACAVAVSCGVSVPGFGRRQALRVGVWFGIFQFIMPLAGWILGAGLSLRLQAAGHCLAFGLLAFLGGKMVAEALDGAASGDGLDFRPEHLTARRLCLLALATSVDALAAGVSLAFWEGARIWAAAGMIGAVAFCLSVWGGLMGRRLGDLFQRRAKLVGGLVLLGIALHVLWEHFR